MAIHNENGRRCPYMSSEKGREFTQLKWKDRLRIEKMLKEKKKPGEIAATLRVDSSTIYREIKRGQTIQRDTNLVDHMVYCAETAERKYQEHLRAKGPGLKIGNDHELANYIEGKIADEGYSPQAEEFWMYTCSARTACAA